MHLHEYTHADTNTYIPPGKILDHCGRVKYVRTCAIFQYCLGCHPEFFEVCFYHRLIFVGFQYIRVCLELKLCYFAFLNVGLGRYVIFKKEKRGRSVISSSSVVFASLFIGCNLFSHSITP